PSTRPTSPSAFVAWQLAHCAAKISRPAATFTEPSGSPPPSGAIAVASSRNSSGVGGRPTPNVGDCAASGSDTVKMIRAMALHLHISHRPVSVDLPEFHLAEVITGARSSQGDHR